MYVLISNVTDDTGSLNVINVRCVSNDNKEIKAKLLNIIMDNLNDIDDGDEVTITSGRNSETDGQYVSLVHKINDGYLKTWYEIQEVEELKN